MIACRRGIPSRKELSTPPAYVRRVISGYARPKAFIGMVATKSVRPFQMRDPDLTEFPAKLWGHLAARRARSFSSWLETEDDGRGYRPLREAIAAIFGIVARRKMYARSDHRRFWRAAGARSSRAAAC